MNQTVTKSDSLATLEALIAHHWANLLGLEKVDHADDFFELGGDSIQAMELVSVLEQALPFEAPLMMLFFADPTVSGLAAAIAQEVGPETLARLHGEPSK